MTLNRPPDVWTKANPTEKGWYWWRWDISRHAVIVYVTEAMQVMRVFSFDRYPVQNQGGEWFGPLQEPGGDAIENCT